MGAALGHHLARMLYLRLYLDCLRRAATGVRKSPWTLALPMIYLAINVVAGILVSPLGIVGGFIMVIVADLCTSSFLYFVGEAVRSTPARPRELQRSFLAYFWPVVSFGFVLWMTRTILGYALAANPQAARIQLAVWLCAAVLLNAVPEVIYQKAEVGGIAIISESIRFIQRHWIEWFIPNALLLAGSWFAIQALMRLPFGLLLVPPVGGALVYLVATFRGNLFHLLETTSPYQLKMRYRRGS